MIIKHFYNFLKIGLIAAVAGICLPGLTLFAQTTPSPTASAAPVVQTVQTTDNTTYVMLEPLPCINTTTGTSNSGDMNCANGTLVGTQSKPINVGDYVQYMFNLLIAVAAVAAVFMITWGGFQYMTTDSWKGKSDGLGKVKNAILGLILVTCSYILLKTIDPRLVTISPTLVPQLQLKCPGDASKTLNDPTCASNTGVTQTTQTAAKQTNTQAQSSVDSAKQNTQTSTTLTQQNANLQAQIDSLKGFGAQDDNPQVQALQAQINNNNDQIQQADVASAVSQAQGNTTNIIATAMTGMNAATNPDAISQVALSSIQTIDKMTATRVQQLQNLNAADQVQTVKNLGAYAQSVISMQEAVQLANMAIVGNQFMYSDGVTSRNTQVNVSEQKILAAYHTIQALPNVDPALLAQTKAQFIAAETTITGLRNRR